MKFSFSFFPSQNVIITIHIKTQQILWCRVWLKNVESAIDIMKISLLYLCITWKFRIYKLLIHLLTYFLYGKLLTHQDFLLAKADVAYVVFLYLRQDIWLIDLSFHRKEDKRDFHNKRHWHFPNILTIVLFKRFFLLLESCRNTTEVPKSTIG